MRQLAVFCFILLITILPSCKFLREKGFLGRRGDTMIVWKAKQDSMRVADSIRKIQARILAIENLKLDSMRKADQERLEWEAKYKFNIILGSFITPEYARGFSQDLAQKGYKTKILKLEGTKFEMVSAEAHESFRTAVKRLKQFQDTISTDAWLYVYKKK